MNKLNCKFKKSFFLIITIMIILLPNKIYSIQYVKQSPKEVIIGGELLHVNIKTNKLTYYKKDGNNNLFNQYDQILSIEGKLVQKTFNKYKIENVKRKHILDLTLNMKDDDFLEFKIIRGEDKLNIKVGKNQISSSYFLEDIPFSASLTYIDPKSNTFGSIAHSVDINNNKNLLSNKGHIYLCENTIIRKSEIKNIGSMYGEKINKNQGDILKINQFGAKGNITGNKILENKNIYEIGNMNELQLGTANLIIEENKEKVIYNINITKINKQIKADTQGFEFDVVDKVFLKKYGGIVQGMSGCPIVQNGKLMGALSHVISTNPESGVGLYIKWMMEE